MNRFKRVYRSLLVAALPLLLMGAKQCPPENGGPQPDLAQRCPPGFASGQPAVVTQAWEQIQGSYQSCRVQGQEAERCRGHAIRLYVDTVPDQSARATLRTCALQLP